MKSLKKGELKMSNSILKEIADKVKLQMISNEYYNLSDHLFSLKLATQRALRTPGINPKAINVMLRGYCEEIQNLCLN